MKKTSAWLTILLFFVLIFIVSVYSIVRTYKPEQTNVVGNQEVLNEINRLLLPVYYQNITESDLNKLKELTKNDNYSSNEVNELALLARYKEYPHIGHGLGFLYTYVKTGKQPICPGHSISHYYVFLKHGENLTAEENLNDAKIELPQWIRTEESRNQSYLNNINYTYYSNLINSSLNNIENGNSSSNDNMIIDLADAPCT